MGRLFRVPTRLASDEGFTIVEVVIAASVLFFALTALFGLAMASTTLGMKAKQRALAVDTAGSYIENLRAMPYAQIGFASGDPTGTLAPSTTTVKNGMSVTITPTVTWIDDPTIDRSDHHDYKKVTLSIQVTSGGVGIYRYVFTTYIRDKDAGSSTASGGTTTTVSNGGSTPDPTIAFTSDTPADGAVLFGNGINIGAVGVHPATDGVLTVMRLIGGNYVTRDTIAGRGEWTINAQTGTRTLVWDTTQSFVDTSTGQSTRYFPDGPIVLTAEVFDALGKRAWVSRTYMIDNSGPDTPPSNLVVTAPTVGSTPFNMTWIPGEDVHTPVTLAQSHRLMVYKQNNTNTDPKQWSGLTTNYEFTVPTPSGSPSSIAYSYTGGADFSRYYFTVQAVGPRWPVNSDHNVMASTAAVAGPYTTRPRITGTGAGGTAHTMTVTAPSFPCVGNVTYQWYCSVSNAAFTLVGTTTNAATLSRTTGINKNSTYRYRVKITYTPSGPGSVTSYAYSQTCGQVSKQNDFTAIDDWTVTSW